MPKYPNISVKLIDEDGNAFAILGHCIKKAKKVGLDQKEIDLFKKEATSGDYNNLLCTCQKWFDII